jgi:hypothetical protein
LEQHSFKYHPLAIWSKRSDDFLKSRVSSKRVSDVLPFGRLCYGEPSAVANAIGYAKFYSRSHDAVIRVYDAAGNVIETHEHTGDFKEW